MVVTVVVVVLLVVWLVVGLVNGIVERLGVVLFLPSLSTSKNNAIFWLLVEWDAYSEIPGVDS